MFIYFLHEYVSILKFMAEIFYGTNNFYNLTYDNKEVYSNWIYEEYVVRKWKIRGLIII